MKRRNFLVGATALAVIPVLPVEAKEVWHHRDIKVVVEREPGWVCMCFKIDDDWYGSGSQPQEEKALRKAVRRSIDLHSGYKSIW